jgi:hypothetical protein
MVKKVLAIVSTILCICSVGLIIGAFHSKDWVKFENATGDDFKYGLWHCSDCPDTTELTSWGCIESYYCEIDDADGICETGEDMVQAGQFYWFSSLFAIAFLIKYSIG